MSTVNAVVPVVQVHVDGTVSPEEIAYARDKATDALRHAGEPVQSIRLRVIRHAHAGARRPVLVQVNVNLNGHPVRVQAVGETVSQAADAVRDRLDSVVARAARGWLGPRGAGGRHVRAPWRDPQAPVGANDGESHVFADAHPDYVVLPPEQREIVRHKTYELGQLGIDDALASMEQMGYDFHLFTERGTGEDSIVYRTTDGYRLSQATPRFEALAAHTAEMSHSPHHAPVLRLEQARQRLDITGLPFVFFIDASTARGCVLYHRYDGHYGLITPAS